MIYKILLFLPFILLFTACDPWEKDKQLKNSNIDKTLNEIIAVDGDISTFAQILKLTGYDQFLQTEQSLTVFAPNNEALQGIDLQNIDFLKIWVQNYIAQLTYITDKSY